MHFAVNLDVQRHLARLLVCSYSINKIVQIQSTRPTHYRSRNRYRYRYRTQPNHGAAQPASTNTRTNSKPRPRHHRSNGDNV